MSLYGTFLIIPNIADLLHLFSPVAKFAVTTGSFSQHVKLIVKTSAMIFIQSIQDVEEKSGLPLPNGVRPHCFLVD